MSICSELFWLRTQREMPTNFSLGKVPFFFAEGVRNFQRVTTSRVRREMFVSHGSFVCCTSLELRNELNHRSSVASADRRRRRVRSVIQSITKTYVLSTTNVLFYMWSHETLVHSSRVIYELHRVELFRGRGSKLFKPGGHQGAARGPYILKLVPTFS